MTNGFRQVEQIARWVDPRVESIESDTLIASRFRGSSLAKFWEACQSQSNGRLPDLVKSPGMAFYHRRLKSWRNTAVVVGTVLLITQIPVQDIPMLYTYAAIVFALYVTLTWYVACGLIVLALNLTGSKPYQTGIFPKGLTTFGAVAEVLDGVRGGWCSKCENDLTGVESDKCPNCKSLRTT